MLASVVIAAVVLAGFWIYWETFPPSTEQQSSSIAGNSTLDESIDRTRNNGGTGQNRSSHPVRDLLKFKSEFKQQTEWHQLVVDSGKNELKKLLNQTTEIENSRHRYLAESVIVAKFAEIDPAGALTHIDGLNDTHGERLKLKVFEIWAVSDLRGAVNHAKTLSPTDKLALMNAIFVARDDLVEGTLLEIAQSLGQEQRFNEYLAFQKTLGPIENPRQLWDEIVGDGQPNGSQIAILSRIAEASVEKFGLSTVVDLLQTIETEWQVRQSVLSSVLYNFAKDDPEKAFQDALNLDNDTHGLILQEIATIWAASDPIAALDAVSLVDSSAKRSQLQSAVIRKWGALDPEDLLASLDLLPENKRQIGLEAAIVGIADTSPEEAVLLLSRIEQDNKRQTVAFQIMGKWGLSDPRSAVDWVLSDSSLNEMTKYSLLQTALHQLVAEDPELAMEIALGQELHHNQFGLEASVINRLAMIDLDAAIAMLSRVREGFSKYSAYASVGRQLVTNDELDRALSLVQDWPQDQQVSYYNQLLPSWAMTDPEELLDNIERLPTESIRSQAAMQLITHNDWQGSLDSDQIAYAKTFLSEVHSNNLRNGGRGHMFYSAGGDAAFAVESTEVAADVEESDEEEESDD